MSYDRRWLEDVGSEDSVGRSFWALGDTAERTSRPDLKHWAEALAASVMPHLEGLHAPRARAFAALGLSSLLAARPDFPGARNLLEKLSAFLMGCLAKHRSNDWVWFEPYVAYDNARLAEALIRAGETLNDPALTNAGLEALEWLCAYQSAPNGVFRAVGTATIGTRAVIPSPFDQQPVEAAATIDACAAAFLATGDADWVDEARRAYDWFLGANDLGAPLADPARGLCYDGLTPDRINLNHGAESILSFQLATLALHALARASRQAPARAMRI